MSWKPIPSEPGYSAHPDGDIRNDLTGAVRRSYVGRDGYPIIRLRRASRTRRTHRLVAEAFLGPCPRGHQVNHRNGKKTDNRAANLEYVTPAENMRHALAHALWHPSGPRGESSYSSLTDSDIRSIRRRAKAGEPYLTICAEFGIQKSAVSKIVHRRTWAHVK